MFGPYNRKNLSPFGTARVEVPSDYKQLKELAIALKDLDLNNLTPLQALNLMESMKSKLPA